MRGTILRDNRLGDGLVVAAGTQHRFDLEGHWRGERAPRVDQVVELALSSDGILLSIEPVDAGTLTSEQGRMALAHGKTVLDIARTQGGLAARRAVAKIGIADLAGVALLAVATTVLTALSVRVMGTQITGLSFYSMLGLLSGGNLIPGTMLGLGGTGDRGAGIFALLWIAAVFGPLVPALTRHRLAPLGYFLPLVLLLGGAAGIGLGVHRLTQAINEMEGYFGGSQVASRLSADMMGGLWQGGGLGAGAYLTLAITLFFVYRGWRAWHARPSDFA